MEMKKPFLNINSEAEYQENDEGAFRESYFPISEKIGADKLGYSVMILEPGFKACPFHNHHINEEMFLVLSGSGTLRFGEEKYEIVKDDIIACPPGGAEFAHQIINTGKEPLKVLCVSTNEYADICEYPDSNKALSMVGKQGDRSFRHISRLGDKVDYFEGES
ncbi:cupin domain-containing protein [Teredinibacter turnerae]|uniref:cupin domain-containing protein n=1 Tax=Teredinibacter turnerae TaxID=2426 RepID=UPI000361DE73|nr:cupin domain-containing protein [Teredinibacter turnerae]